MSGFMPENSVEEIVPRSKVDDMKIKRNVNLSNFLALSYHPFLALLSIFYFYVILRIEVIIRPKEVVKSTI